MIWAGLSLLAVCIAVFSCAHTIWFVRRSRGYREESRAQIARMGTSIVQLAEENSALRQLNTELRDQAARAQATLAELQRLRGDGGPG